MKKEEIVMGLYAMRLQGKNRVAQERNNTVDRAVELINQLDEPEKIAIPQFVADYIESQDDPIYEMCLNYEMWGVNGGDGTTRFTREVAEWFDDHINVENYYRACIDGYEVEKEKLYRVVFPYKGEMVYLKESAHGDFDVIETETYGTQYTEAEIKAIDKRYWVFAEEVTQ